jgi:hypothetical protein
LGRLCAAKATVAERRIGAASSSRSDRSAA